MAEAARAAPASDGGFLRVATIARGGIGTVELVMREKGAFRRLYALKRLHEHLRHDPEINRMFKEEARLAGLLRHRNVVSVIDVGEDEEGPYLLMDFVDGLPLSKVVTQISASGDLLPVSICLRIAREVAAGLSAAHELTEGGKNLTLVHRDISPQNILIAFDGSVKVTDFGIAKAVGGDGQTTTHALKGKYGYMSPEQLRFQRLDPRADLFALGVVLWEMLAGKRLYRERSLEDAARRILEEPPPEIEEERADVPPEVEALLLALLAKDRDARPNTAADVVEALDLALRAVEEEEGTFTIAAFLDQRFGPLREDLESARARAIEVARAKAESAPEPVPAAPSTEPSTPRSLARLAIIVFTSAILGAAILLGAQALRNDPPQAQEQAQPQEQERAQVQEQVQAQEQEQARAQEQEQARAQEQERTQPRRRRRRRPRMRPGMMTGMMTSALDDWWSE